MYTVKNAEKTMQPDEFRFLGSINYCLKKSHYFFYYYINFYLLKCHPPVNGCTTETDFGL